MDGKGGNDRSVMPVAKRNRSGGDGSAEAPSRTPKIFEELICLVWPHGRTLAASGGQ